MKHEYDVLGGYVPSFVQHLKETGARLGLRVGSHANEDRINAGDTAEDVTGRALSGWTPVEHDAFFRAVSVHSRWRPDLIAACVPTKTEWEVWMYLEALEEGVALLGAQEDGEDVDMVNGPGLVEGRRDVRMQINRFALDSRSHSDSDGDEDLDLDAREPALEVSQAWIDAEEHMAAWIIDEERLASLAGDTAADPGEPEDKPPERKRRQPRGSSKGRAQSRVRGQTISSKRSSPRSPSLEFASTSARESVVPSRELMSRLEVPHLLVLDSILRESEEATMEKSKSREDSVIAAALTVRGDEGQPRAHSLDMLSLSDRTAGSPGTSNALEFSSNIVIDPVLLALSGNADHSGRQSGQAWGESAMMSCVPAQDPSSLSNVSHPTPSETSSHPGTSNMWTFPQDHATLDDSGPNVNAESELSLFSPHSRRRIQKRLYMRRKRALLRGDVAASEGAIGTGIQKLRPGKKAKSKHNETSAVPISVPCPETPADAEAELAEDAPRKNKPGLTLAYKLKAQFAEMGIDAAYLCDQGMNLLNLGALGKLMGLYSSLEHGEQEADESAIPGSIDAQLIQHLQAAVVSYVTDVVHRAVVWREREIRLKQRSRAWRQGDQITVGAVEHAVGAIGARYRSHKAYFRSLEALHDPTSASVNAPEATDASVDSVVGVADLPRFSPHRDAYTPLVRPPSGWEISPLACLARTYEQEATRTRRGTSTDDEEGELMSDETDEDALEAELEEEAAVDARDMASCARRERDLWDAVGENK